MKIRWRNRNPYMTKIGGGLCIDYNVKTSLKNYNSKESAQKQIDIFQQVFPFNSYYIE